MDNLPQALKELAEIADELNIGKHCGCWVVKEGEYWSGRRLCVCECECECHDHSDAYIRLLDAVPALAESLLAVYIELKRGHPCDFKEIDAALARLAAVLNG